MSTCNLRPDGTSGYDADGNLLFTRTVRGPARAAGTDGCSTPGAVEVQAQTTVYDDRDWPTSVTTAQTPPAGGAPVVRTQRMTYHANGSKAALTHVAGSQEQTTSYGISPAGWDETVTEWRGRVSAASCLPAGSVATYRLGAAAGGQPVAAGEFGYHRDASLSSLAWTAGGQTVRSHTAIGYDVGGDPDR